MSSSAYRTLLRELGKHKCLTGHLRAVFEKGRASDMALFERDVQNAAAFMRAQREYKRLSRRYNPLSGLSTEERVHATARRVGLDMPVTDNVE